MTYGLYRISLNCNALTSELLLLSFNPTVIKGTASQYLFCCYPSIKFEVHFPSDYRHYLDRATSN